MTVLVINAVGLTPKALAHMPRLSKTAEDGFQAELSTVLPAVTCSAQSTYLTGLEPSDHGIVANGWYFRELGEVFLWRQHNKLVHGEKVWETARKVNPEFRAANVCWWYAMGGTTDLTVTPRPIYYADGRKEPDCYTDPPQLHDRLVSENGEFPLFTFWGPGAGISSSQWIANASQGILERDKLDMLLVYLPHLDYDLQRFGPDGPEAIRAAAELDDVAGDLIDAARARGDKVVVLSEYGITPANSTVDINRVLRSEGLLRVYTQDGMEYLDPWTSRAFAVADHQIAHVYVREPTDIPAVRTILEGVEGIDVLLSTADEKAGAGLNHPRSGEIIAVAAPGAWFTYYYWLDDSRAPDFARLVEIHRKPGYDPAELFFDPEDKWAKPRAGLALARKKLGFRYLMDVVPLNGRAVRGTHGRLPEDPADSPVLICSDSSLASASVKATEVRDLLLDLCEIPR